MKIGTLLSIREKATRLPGKVLLPVLGRPAFIALLQRLQQAKIPDEIIVATSTHPQDGVLVDLAGQYGFKSFCGSPADKLLRYRDAAHFFNLDAVIIVDGDDLLCFPEGIDCVAKQLLENTADCIYLENLPLGAAATGLTREALDRVIELKDEEDTEVWGGYFIRSPYFTAQGVTLPEAVLHHPEIRMTLDYVEDYEFFSEVFNHFAHLNFTSVELMELLTKFHPEFNERCLVAQQKYEQHLTKAAPVRFRKAEEGTV